MLGEISDTVQIRVHGMLRIVPELQVFPHALAEWGHGLASSWSYVDSFQAKRGAWRRPGCHTTHGGVIVGQTADRGETQVRREGMARPEEALLPERSEWFVY